MNKQIYASLEIREKEVHLIIGEFFNTRLNILKEESIEIKEIKDFKIIDKDLLISKIKKLIEDSSRSLGANIERVILILPSVNFKRQNCKITIKTETGLVNYSDIKKAINIAIDSKVDETSALVNVVCNTYTVNGISYRKIPIKEISKEITIDIDLLQIDKEIAYDYVSLVESAGVRVLDVCLDTYAICKEAALFEKTVHQNIILIKTEYNHTTLSLISRGRLMGVEIFKYGLNNLIDKVYNKYRLSLSNIERLIKYNLVTDMSKVSDSVIHLWEVNDLKMTLSEKTLAEILAPEINYYVEELKKMCQPILDSGEVSLILVGEGSKAIGIKDKIQNEFKVNSEIYIPETLGARDSSLTSLLGSLYNFKDLLNVNENKLVSIDLLAFEDLVNKKVIDGDGESFTRKIMGLFKERKRDK